MTSSIAVLGATGVYGRHLVPRLGLGLPSYRASNRRAREALCWTPVYANFRIGLAR
jgi:hypothetical protein